nr:hypothetical protein [Nostoc sp. SerVER01]
MNEPVKNLSSGQKLVTIDKSTGKALSNKSFLGIGNLLKDTEYYLVSSGSRAEDKFVYSDKVFGTGSFSLVIEYQVSCEIENAQKVAEALCLAPHPGAKLQQKIEKYARDFIRKHRDEFINDFPQGIKNIIKFIIKEVETEVFLTIDIQISLDESKLKPYLIESQHFRVLVQDCNEELNLELQAELIVDPKNKIKAISNYDNRSSLSDLVKEEIKHYLFSTVSLQDFYYDLKTSVYQRIKTNLNLVLADQGLQIRSLSIDTNEVAPPRLSQIEESITCQVQEYSEPVVIKNRLQMIPSDVSKYRMAGSPSLTNWVKSQLEAIIPEELFAQSIDILFNFEKTDPYNNIKQKMILEAKKIGYDINQLVSVAELKFDSLTKDFVLKDESVFSIKSSSGKLEVKLNIIVTTKIDKLENIKNYLKREISVEEFQGLIKTKIHNTVSQYLHKVEPDRYYLRFDFEDDQQNPKVTVKEELENKIKEVLKTEFSASVSDIVLERLDTEVSELSKNLYSKGDAFELELQSKLDYGETVRFTGYLQVGGVDPDCWYVFQYRLPNLNDIKAFVLDTLQQKLEEKYSTDELTSEENTSLQVEVNQWAKASIIEQFGLEVEIKNWKRSRTESEIDLAQLELKTHKTKISGMNTKLVLVELKDKNKIETAKLAYEKKLERQKQLYGTRDQLELPDEDKVIDEIKNLEQATSETSVENVEAELNQLKESKSKRRKPSEFRGKTQEEPPKISESEKQKLLKTNEEEDLWLNE